MLANMHQAHFSVNARNAYRAVDILGDKSHALCMATRQFFKQWRKHRHLTQERAVERLPFDQSTLSRLERGKIAFNQEHLEALAHAYACDPADLLIRDPSDPEGIWSLWERVPPLSRPQALRVIQAFADQDKTGTD